MGSSMVSPLGGASNKSESSSSYQSKSYSASSSSVDGGLPHYSSSSDSVYKSTRTGPSNVHHTVTLHLHLTQIDPTGTMYHHSPTTSKSKAPFGARIFLIIYFQNVKNFTHK